MKKPDIRYLYDMKKVLFDKDWFKTASNLELYYMYRGIKRRKDLRYDITVIPPQMLGNEFIKTKGHEHDKNFSEVYIVLSGQAIYLIQKSKNNKVSDAYFVKAKKGQVVIIPPGYGHIAINPSNLILKEANWVSEKCKNIYSFFEKMQGGCYFYTKKGWVKNKNYSKVPKLRLEKPLKSIPKNLEFLKG